MVPEPPATLADVEGLVRQGEALDLTVPLSEILELRVEDTPRLYVSKEIMDWFLAHGGLSKEEMRSKIAGIFVPTYDTFRYVFDMYAKSRREPPDLLLFGFTLDDFYGESLSVDVAVSIEGFFYLQPHSNLWGQDIDIGLVEGGLVSL